LIVALGSADQGWVEHASSRGRCQAGHGSEADVRRQSAIGGSWPGPGIHERQLSGALRPEHRHCSNV